MEAMTLVFRYTEGNKFALHKLQKSLRRHQLLHIQGSQGKKMFEGNFFSLYIHIQVLESTSIYMHFKTVFRNMVKHLKCRESFRQSWWYITAIHIIFCLYISYLVKSRFKILKRNHQHVLVMSFKYEFNCASLRFYIICESYHKMKSYKS